MSLETRKDLIVLTAGKDERAAITAVLCRYRSLRIRPIAFSVELSSRHDLGCRWESQDQLRAFLKEYERALVMFDHEGCGDERRSAVEVETAVRQALEGNGWLGRCDCVVIEPELEAWTWSDSPHVADALGWEGQGAGLRQWLGQEGFLAAGQMKPARPKEAMRAALRQKHLSPTSLIFAKLASVVSFDRCTDPSFLRFKAILQKWFGA